MSYHSLSVLSRKYSHGVKAMLRLHLSSTAEKERRPVAGERYATGVTGIYFSWWWDLGQCVGELVVMRG